MTKNEILNEINTMVKDITASDKFKSHQDCVLFSCRGGYSIEFNELQKVSIANDWYIHTIDTNNMVLLDFEGSSNTTDWLPLAILDEKYINNLYDVIKDLHKEMDIKKCYILCNKWTMPDEDGCEIIKVLDTLEKAQKVFNEYVKCEFTETWLYEFVDAEGDLLDASAKNIHHYEYKKNENFYLSVEGGYCTDIYIEERVIF